jgi:hypothetical protein
LFFRDVFAFFFLEFKVSVFSTYAMQAWFIVFSSIKTCCFCFLKFFLIFDFSK